MVANLHFTKCVNSGSVFSLAIIIIVTAKILYNSSYICAKHMIKVTTFRRLLRLSRMNHGTDYRYAFKRKEEVSVITSLEATRS